MHTPEDPRSRPHGSSASRIAQARALPPLAAVAADHSEAMRAWSRATPLAAFLSWDRAWARSSGVWHRLPLSQGLKRLHDDGFGDG